MLVRGVGWKRAVLLQCSAVPARSSKSGPSTLRLNRAVVAPVRRKDRNRPFLMLQEVPDERVVRRWDGFLHEHSPRGITLLVAQ